MSLRRALGFAVFMAAALARSDAHAQQPLPPRAPIAPPTTDGPDRLQSLVSPSAPADPPVGAAPAAPVPVREERNYGLTSGWLDGLRFKSADNAFHVHVGGNAQIDSTWLIAPNSAYALPNGSISGIGGAAATFIRR